MTYTPKERDLLRELARRVAEIAALPAQQEKRRLWTAHNRLRGERPMVLCYPEGAWLECIPPDSILCRDPVLYGWEKRLRMQLFCQEQLRDDTIVEPYFNIGWLGGSGGWGGMDIVVDRPAGAEAWSPRNVYYLYPNSDTSLQAASTVGAWHWTPPLREYADLDRLGGLPFAVDDAETRRRLALAQDLFGDLLPARIHGWMWTGAYVAPHAVRLRGLDRLMLDCIDNPAWVHRLVAHIADSVGGLLERMERGGYLSTNNEGDWVGSGGIGCTDELPAPGFDPAHVRLCDIWGVSETQDLTGFSPGMWEDFFMRYTNPLLARFGLNCFGCCEPLHDRIAGVRQIPKLRRVSISPWCDVRTAAEGFGGDVILSWKPNPALLSGEHVDWDAWARRLREGLAIFRANGCRVEVIMKDLVTVRGDPARVSRFVAVARQALAE